MTDDDEYTIENAALNHYSDWWQWPEKGDNRYMTRWERLQANIKEGEMVEVSRLIREAHVYAYLAGVALRLTGEELNAQSQATQVQADTHSCGQDADQDH